MSSGFKVGSFAKDTGAAPASQAVTGVGFTPRALILYTANNVSSNSVDADSHLSLGFVTASACGSASVAGQDGVIPSNVSQRLAAVALTIVGYGETLIAEATLTSLDSDGFTLSWTTNDANAYLVGYVAFDAVYFSDANVIDITLPTTTASAVSATGMGFKADMLFIVGNKITASPPVSTAGLDLAFGMASLGGSQGGIANDAADGSSGATRRTRVDRIMRPGANDNGSGSLTMLDSIDSDGLTLRALGSGTSAYHNYVLGLKGGIWSGGAQGGKPTTTAPVDQTVDVMTETPGLLGLAGTGAAWTVAGAATSGCSWQIGFSDGTTSVCVAVTHASTSVYTEKSVTRTDKFFVKMPATTVTAVADTPTLAATNSTVTWSTNDSGADAQVWIVGAPSGVMTGAIPGTGALAFTGGDPTTRTPVQPAGAALSLTGAAGTLATAASMTPTAGALVTTGQAPTQQSPSSMTPGAAGLDLTGAAPGLTPTVLAAPDAGALALTGAAPSVGALERRTPPAALLTLAGEAAFAEGPSAKTPLPGALVLAAGAPASATSATGTRPPLRLDAGGVALDLGGGSVGLLCRAHELGAESSFDLQGTANYDGVWLVGAASTENVLVISAPLFIPETFSGAEIVIPLPQGRWEPAWLLALHVPE